ncbi:MAG: 2-C-methyl-D-erythritol 2,4-cyclodiphosphate synthase [Cytophagales bacterium]|nr:MAG: 2-C-methyl-D-erythritol 2,4-cyclodiphosphate synthase [Cytophagales bacterium]
MDFRVGFGFDTHELVEGRELWLGGIKIEHNKGALGHSDADVLIHAICDALLGAANLRDIGFHFSNTDARWKSIDSKILLKETNSIIQNKGFKITNIDATLCLEEPKINPHIEKMQDSLADCLKIESDRISIKATTNEHMGYVGRKEGVNAYAVALIYK